MAWQISKRVWTSIRTEGDNKKNVDASERLMLLALADKADENGICWPKHDTSYQTLGEMVGVNRRSAMRLVDSLCGAGHVWKSETVGRGHSNIFIVTIGLPEEEIVTKKAIIGVTADTIIKEEKVLPEAPIAELEKEMVLPVTQKGVTADTNYGLNGVTGNTQSYHDPSIPSLSKDSGSSEKWNNTNKKIVGDKFLELTQLKPPANKKTAGAWWGWLFEIFEMADRDAAETCRVMGIVVGYMRSRHTDITSPKSLINYSRVVASGQELAGSQNGPHQDQPRASPPKVGEINQDRYQQLLQGDKP